MFKSEWKNLIRNLLIFTNVSKINHTGKYTSNFREYDKIPDKTALNTRTQYALYYIILYVNQDWKKSNEKNK